MSGYLLDTNVLSELVRKRPDAAVASRVVALRSQEAATSAICVMELRFGAARHPAGRQLWGRVAQGILAHLLVLPVDETVAREAGDVLASLEAAGTPIGTEDVLIGATARVHGLTVVTRNVRHLGRIPGIRVESWWGT